MGSHRQSRLMLVKLLKCDEEINELLISTICFIDGNKKTLGDRRIN